MDEQIINFILRITNQGLMVVIIVCGPPIVLSMVVGLMISLFQAITQIQEATLTFVPKMIIIFGTLAAMGPFLGGTLHAWPGPDRGWVVQATLPVQHSATDPSSLPSSPVVPQRSAER